MEKKDMAIIIAYSTLIKSKYTFDELMKMKKNELEAIYKDLLKKEENVLLGGIKNGRN